MKTIKKVAVTPIEPKTGHIYDTTNIDNKAENTYSANILDTRHTGLQEQLDNIYNITPVTDISVLFEIKSGYTLLEHGVYKDRTRYFGYLTIKKDSGNFSTTAVETVATVKKVQKNGKYLNTGCFLGNNQWNTKVVGHMILDWEKLQVANFSGGGDCNFAKIHFDIVTYG